MQQSEYVRRMTASEASIRSAISNIIHFGDTDVFPFPLEKRWFEGDTAEVVKLLKGIDKDFHTLWSSPDTVDSRLMRLLG
jgi:hypothetical protein